MAKKEIQFKAVLDSSGFDKTMSDLQKKAQSLNADSNRFGTTARNRGMAQQAGFIPGQRADGSLDSRMRQTLKELEDFSKKQFDMSEKILANMKKREESIKNLRKELSSETKDAQEKEQIQRRILELEEKRRRLGQAYDRRSEAFQSARGSIESMDPSGRLRGGGAISNWWQGQKQMAGGSALGAAGGIVGGLAAVTNQLSNVVRSFASIQRQTTEAQGAATSSIVGGVINPILSGRSSDNFFYSAENLRAAQSAGRELDRNKIADTMQGAAGLGMLGAGALGILGTGGLGAIAAGGYGAYKIATDSQFRTNVGGTLDRMTGGHLGLAEDMRAQQLLKYSQNMESMRNAERLKDPLKVAARERYFQSLGRNTGIERGLGITTDRFLGAYTNEATSNDFTVDSLAGQTQSILGAGGSTAQAGSALGLKLQRNLNLTNQAGILGRISSLQNNRDTEETTVRFLAEGVKKGLSESAQENRDFVQAIATFASASAYSKEGMAHRGEEFSAFLGSMPTRGEIAAVSSTSAAYDALTGDTDGPGGVFFQSKLMNDSSLKGLSATSRFSLSQLKASEISSDRPEIRAAAREMNFEGGAEGLARYLSNMKSESVGGPLVQDARRRAGEKYPGDLRAQDDMIFSETSAYFGNMGLNALSAGQLGSRIRRGGITSSALAEEQEGVRTELLGGKYTGKMGDLEEAASARGDVILSEEMVRMKGAMEDSAEAASKMNRSLFETAQRLANLAALSQAKTADEVLELVKSFDSEVPLNPPNASKSSGD